VVNGAPSVRALHLVDRFVHELVVALLNHGMHPPGSQLVRDGLRDVTATLRELLTEARVDGLALEIQGELLRAFGRDLIAASLQAGLLTGLCARSGVRSLTFARGLEPAEFGRFLAALFECGTPGADLPRALAAHGVRHVTAEVEPGTQARAGNTPRGLRGYRELTSFLHDNHIAAFRGEDLEVDRAQGVVEQAIDHIEREPSALLTLASYDDIDSFTVGHSVRVALLALHVARAAGVAQGDLVAIGTAALLHDIGKSRVPQEILFKRGRLDPDEWRLMAQHPRLGAEILLEQRNLDPRAIGAAFCHHMSPDGGGYPVPTLRFAPSEVSKLVRVCDVFEALTAARPYKRALTPVQAYAVMFASAHDFDPTWLRFFARTIGLYPLGTRVQLSTGAEACVVAHGPDPQRPVVRVAQGGPGQVPLAGTNLTIGDLVDGEPVRIAAVLGAGAERTEVAEVLRSLHCGGGTRAGHC